MATVDLNTPIRDIDGKTIKNPSGEDFTIKDVLLAALLTVKEGDAHSPAEEKVKRFGLAVRISSSQADELDFSAEELVQLKGLVNQVYPNAVVVARAYEILNA